MRETQEAWEAEKIKRSQHLPFNDTNVRMDRERTREREREREKDRDTETESDRERERERNIYIQP